MEFSSAKDEVTASLITRPALGESVGAGGVYTVVCHDANGSLKWTDSFHNLVVNQGLQDMNTKYFSGAAYTAAWYSGFACGLDRKHSLHWHSQDSNVWYGYHCRPLGYS